MDREKNVSDLQGSVHTEWGNLLVACLVPCSSLKWPVQLPSPSEAKPQHGPHGPPCSPSVTWLGVAVRHLASSSPVPTVPPSLPRFLCNTWWIPAAGRCLCHHLSLRSCIAVSRRGQREAVGSFGRVQSRARRRAGRSVTLPQELTWSKDGATMNGLASFQHSGISAVMVRAAEYTSKHLHRAKPPVRGKAGLCNGHMGLCHPLGMLGGGKKELCWAEMQPP